MGASDGAVNLGGLAPESAAPDLLAAHAAVRRHTLDLAAPLSPEDCAAQSMADASPVKWHLAHTTWFFETFLLERWETDFRPFDPAFRILFNSYYNSVGEKHPRPQRGLLTRPDLGRVLDYRAAVDERVRAVLGRNSGDAELRQLLELGLHHEQQHQELLLTDVKHLLSCNPLDPAYDPAGGRLLPGAAAGPLNWIGLPGGVAEIGHQGGGFCFDNEMPRHRVYLQPYRLASRLVTNAEYAAFVAAGGYDDPALWLSDGWDWRTAQARRHPLYWRREGSQWREFTLHGLQSLDPGRPAVHLAYYEADAYARWAGARLPTEAEWEHAATAMPSGLDALYGAAWQWTSSSYAPYPGFRAAPGAVGEYNGKFMVNQYVLRGSSLATPQGHTRASYRNFFPAAACWQFTGIRLARDA